VGALPLPGRGHGRAVTTRISFLTIVATRLERRGPAV
jgi:hypothetical protein